MSLLGKIRPKGGRGSSPSSGSHASNRWRHDYGAASPRSSESVRLTTTDYMGFIQRFGQWIRDLVWRSNNMQPMHRQKEIVDRCDQRAAGDGGSDPHTTLASENSAHLYPMAGTQRPGVERGSMSRRAGFSKRRTLSKDIWRLRTRPISSRSRTPWTKPGQVCGDWSASIADNPFQEDRVVDISNREGRWSTEIQHGLDSLGSNFGSANSAAILKQVNPYTKSVLESFDDLISAERRAPGLQTEAAQRRRAAGAVAGTDLRRRRRAGPDPDILERHCCSGSQTICRPCRNRKRPT